jgi:hypothetical protein
VTALPAQRSLLGPATNQLLTTHVAQPAGNESQASCLPARSLPAVANFIAFDNNVRMWPSGYRAQKPPASMRKCCLVSVAQGITHGADSAPSLTVGARVLPRIGLRRTCQAAQLSARCLPLCDYVPSSGCGPACLQVPTMKAVYKALVAQRARDNSRVGCAVLQLVHPRAGNHRASTRWAPGHAA